MSQMGLGNRPPVMDELVTADGRSALSGKRWRNNGKSPPCASKRASNLVPNITAQGRIHSLVKNFPASQADCCRLKTSLCLYLRSEAGVQIDSYDIDAINSSFSFFVQDNASR